MMRRIFKFRRRARLAAALALLAAVAVVVILVLSTRSQPGTGSATSVATATGSTTVKRRDLVEMDTEAGTVSYADPQTVYNRLSGTITWLPRVGQVIKPGQTLYRVDGAPVLLMNGSTPAYRDLKASDIEGADIEQLNRNLVALGFNANAIVVDDLWQPATTTGVELLQASSAKTATGSLPLGQIVFLPDDQTGSGHSTRRSGRPAAGVEARGECGDRREHPAGRPCGIRRPSRHDHDTRHRDDVVCEVAFAGDAKAIDAPEEAQDVEGGIQAQDQ